MSVICMCLMSDAKTLYLALHVMENRIAELLPTHPEKTNFFSWLLKVTDYLLFTEGLSEKLCSYVSTLLLSSHTSHTKASAIPILVTILTPTLSASSGLTYAENHPAQYSWCINSIKKSGWRKPSIWAQSQSTRNSFVEEEQIFNEAHRQLSVQIPVESAL